MIKHNINLSNQYKPKPWNALSSTYPLTTAYIQSVFPTDSGNMPWNALDGYGNMAEIVHYCQCFGFATRIFGHCDEVSLIIYTGEPAYIRTGEQHLMASALVVIFSQLEPVLADLVSKGLPAVPPLRDMPPSLELFINEQDSTTLEFQPFMEGVSIESLRQKMAAAGILYLEYVFDRTLVWKKDLARIEGLVGK